MKLRSYELSPPGQYSYVQTEGLQQSFGPSPMIEQVAQQVAAFRRGNGLPRASFAEALADVDTFTCARLGNSSTWCTESNAPYGMNDQATPAIAGCKGCGAVIT